MSSNPKYRLVYFDVRALAEPIRWIFAYSGTPYVDERIPWNYVTWYKETKARYADSVTQIPVLHEEGKGKLCQSHVISRYLATKFGLVGDDEWDNAKIDEIISLIYDLFISWRSNVFERNPEIKKEGKIVVDTKFKVYYKKFSKVLSEREGDFVLGNKLTHADFWLANFISMWNEPLEGDGPVLPTGMCDPKEDDFYVGLAAEFPEIAKHNKVVCNLPPIKEWISKRHQTIL